MWWALWISFAKNNKPKVKIHTFDLLDKMQIRFGLCNAWLSSWIDNLCSYSVIWYDFTFSWAPGESIFNLLHFKLLVNCFPYHPFYSHSENICISIGNNKCIPHTSASHSININSYSFIRTFVCVSARGEGNFVCKSTQNVISLDVRGKKWKL